MAQHSVADVTPAVVVFQGSFHAGPQSPQRADTSEALALLFLPCSAPSAAPRENGLVLCDIASLPREAMSHNPKPFSRGAAKGAEEGTHAGALFLISLRSLRLCVKSVWVARV